MNLIISLVKRDYRFTFKNLLIRSIFFTMIFTIFGILDVMKNKSIQADDINLFFSQLKSIKYFDRASGNQFPFIWFFVNFFVIFNLGDNFYNDLKKNGKYVLVRCGNIKYFYIVKVMLLIVNTIIYYILLFGIIMILSKIFLNPSEVTCIEGVTINNSTVTIMLWVLYTTTSICLVLIQNMLSLVMNPKFSCLISILLLFLSLVIIYNVLPGQQSLILRHVPFDNSTNLTVLKSALYNFALSTVTIIAGYTVFLKKDIY